MDNAVSLSLLGLAAVPLFIKKGGHWITLGGIAASYSTLLLKKAVAAAFPGNRLFLRPAGAYNCNIINRGGPVEYVPAFPSGHMSATVFLLLAMFPVFSNTPLIYISLACVYAAAMGWSRYSKHCHNILQLAGGVVWGSVCFWAFNQFVKR